MLIHISRFARAKMLFDKTKDAERKAGFAAPPPEPRRLDATDKEAVRHWSSV